MIPILTDEMILSSTMNARLKPYEFEADEDYHCVTCRYLSAHGTCLSAKCPHKTIAPNKEDNK
jgi:hypothetical protein